MSRSAPILALCVGAAALLSPAGVQATAARVHSIAIGINDAVTTDAGHPGAISLRYADDDAAAFHAFASAFEGQHHLLAAPDAETLRRYPDWLRNAHPPALSELKAVVAELRDTIAKERAGGIESSVLIFYSGHGSLPEEGVASLNLAGGPLTQAVLYDEVLEPLRNVPVHLFVDACYAESVVVPRDAQAQIVAVTDADRLSYVRKTLPSRFPNVGTIIATSSSAQAHEWDAFNGGVFTHALLSGLRGPADVNGDRRIEYSELGAFLSAASREVQDARARLHALIQPPRFNMRAPIVELGGGLNAAGLRLTGSTNQAVLIEDSRGNRLLDVRPDLGFKIEILVPADVPLTVRTGSREVELVLNRGQWRELNEVDFREPTMASKGGLDRALRRGLFATPYGPSYYKGYVDSQDQLPAVEVPTTTSLSIRETTTPVGPSPATRARSAASGWLGGGAALALASAGIGGLALKARADFDRTDNQRRAEEARRLYGWTAPTSLSLAASATISFAIGGWLWRYARLTD